ncbi:hypothetical protein STENM327S_00210 [Streptomyces tendae]
MQLALRRDPGPRAVPVLGGAAAAAALGPTAEGTVLRGAATGGFPGLAAVLRGRAGPPGVCRAALARHLRRVTVPGAACSDATGTVLPVTAE